MITIKLKEITSQREDIVSIVKASSDPDSVVRVYEAGSSVFIHSTSGTKQVLSISHPSNIVNEGYWMCGIREIMKLKLEDALINVRPSGVVFISEKPEHIPRVAY